MYTISQFGDMIHDRVRTNAYAEALRTSVNPNSVVLDIGTGSGILALLACKFGARRVYAIEPSDAIQLARELAAANGVAQRIEFIRNVSTRVSLPESADVIVSDLHGVLPLHEQSVASIIDARKRFLSPYGAVIPQREELWAAVVEAPALYDRYISRWDVVGHDLNMQLSRRMAVNTWYKGQPPLTSDRFLVQPICWAMLDYSTIECPHVKAEITWTASHPGTGHGLSVWFDSTLIEGVHFSNAPGASDLIYGSAFFPWPMPVSIDVGDKIAAALEARLVGQDYHWRWDTVVLRKDSSEHFKAHFRQCTFSGTTVPIEVLRKRSHTHVPHLNTDGEVDRFILGLMDTGDGLGEIAHMVSAKFPERFADWKDALSRVGELSQKYSL